VNELANRTRRFPGFLKKKSVKEARHDEPEKVAQAMANHVGE
jgi:hypothetical protein